MDVCCVNSSTHESVCGQYLLHTPRLLINAVDKFAFEKYKNTFSDNVFFQEWANKPTAQA